MEIYSHPKIFLSLCGGEPQHQVGVKIKLARRGGVRGGKKGRGHFVSTLIYTFSILYPYSIKTVRKILLQKTGKVLQ